MCLCVLGCDLRFDDVWFGWFLVCLCDTCACVFAFVPFACELCVCFVSLLRLCVFVFLFHVLVCTNCGLLCDEVCLCVLPFLFNVPLCVVCELLCGVVWFVCVCALLWL